MLVMYIIVFIALVASFSLKYLPISEIKFVPLLMGMEVIVICYICSLQIYKKCHIGKLLSHFILDNYIIYDNLRNLNHIIKRLEKKRSDNSVLT